MSSKSAPEPSSPTPQNTVPKLELAAPTPPEEMPGDIYIRAEEANAPDRPPMQPGNPLHINANTSPQTFPVRYGGFWVRLAAFFVDGVIISLVAFPASILMGFLGVAISAASLGRINAQPLVYLGGMLVGALYHVIMLKAYGATVGKMAVGLKVIPIDGGHLTLNQIILREVLGKFISNITFGVGYLMTAVTGKKQALHDKLAHTVVVYKDPHKKNTVAIIIIVLAILPLFAIFIAGIVASITVVSIKNAKNKATEAFVMSKMRETMTAMQICTDAGGHIQEPLDIHQGGGSVCSEKIVPDHNWPDLTEISGGQGLAYNFNNSDLIGGFAVIQENNNNALVAFCDLKEFSCKKGEEIQQSDD